MDILIVLVTFLIGWICGELWAVFKIRSAIKKIAEQNQISLEVLEKDYFGSLQKENTIHTLFTESTENSIILYSMVNGTFICQATSLDDLAKYASEYKNIKMAVVHHNQEELYFINGQVKFNES